MSFGRLASIGVILIVLATVIAGLVISGSPEEQRLLRTDDRRVTDLQQLSRSIERYYRDTEMLPSDLETLLNGWASSGLPLDPETNQDYDYELESGRTYRLCADFALNSRPNRQPDFWSHAGGHQCYSFDYSALVLD